MDEVERIREIVHKNDPSLQKEEVNMTLDTLFEYNAVLERTQTKKIIKFYEPISFKELKHVVWEFKDQAPIVGSEEGAIVLYFEEDPDETD